MTTNFQKYRNKETGEIVEATYIIGDCFLFGEAVEDAERFLEQYQLIENNNDN